MTGRRKTLPLETAVSETIKTTKTSYLLNIAKNMYLRAEYTKKLNSPEYGFPEITVYGNYFSKITNTSLQS